MHAAGSCERLLWTETAEILNHSYLLCQLVKQRFHQGKMTKVIGAHHHLTVVFGVCKRQTSHSSVKQLQVNAWLRLKTFCKAPDAAQICKV